MVSMEFLPAGLFLPHALILLFPKTYIMTTGYFFDQDFSPPQPKKVVFACSSAFHSFNTANLSLESQNSFFLLMKYLLV